MLHRFPGRKQQAADVDVKDPLVMFDRDGLEGRELVDARVVHEDVEPAKGGLGFGDEAGDVSGLGDVALNGDGLAAGGLDLGDDRIGTSFAGGIVNDDGRTGGGEVLGDGGADALGGTGDEGYFIGELGLDVGFHG